MSKVLITIISRTAETGTITEVWCVGSGEWGVGVGPCSITLYNRNRGFGGSPRAVGLRPEGAPRPIARC